MQSLYAMANRALLLVAFGLLLGGMPAAVAYQSGEAANAAVSEISLAELPPEARRTLELIKKGGPFPFARDGIPFGNRERLLPRRARGFYHEYTVPTPHARNRGARRIIAGAPGEYYYTDDHYRSFKRLKE